MGEAKKGIKWMIKNTKYMVDDVRRNEQFVRLYLQNKQTKKACEHLEQLLELNSTNKEYYLQVLQASEIDLKNDEQVLEKLNSYEEIFPKTNAHVRLTLDLISSGPKFEEKLLGYVRPLIIKGVPSLIRVLRNLYPDQGKRDIIEKFLLSFTANMEKDRVLSQEDDQE